MLLQKYWQTWHRTPLLLPSPRGGNQMAVAHVGDSRIACFITELWSHCTTTALRARILLNYLGKARTPFSLSNYLLTLGSDRTYYANVLLEVSDV